MPHQLPVLPYAADALQTVISKNTIDFHHGKHHQAYVTNLNNLLPGTRFEQAELEDIIRQADGAIFNNAAQIWNHTFYFTTFSAKPKTEPHGRLAEVITQQYGSLGNLKEQFSRAAVSLFGSGWAWLVKNTDGTLNIVQEANAGCPLKQGLVPLLTCDVWEHAYYLDYQNRRADYVQAFWNIVDWDIVSGRY
jgi:superoxide dismutase, Fe-Mn family